MTLITIIIPTHNRQDYAAVAARKIVSLLPDAQLVISDTSADDRLRTLLPIENGNVEYVRPGRPMDVVSHFEFALDHARGRYIMFLGDDDCVGPGLNDVARWADRNAIDAVISYGATFLANYYWPGVQSKYYGDAYSARLFIHPFTGQAQRIDPQVARRDVLRDLGRGLGLMPRIYHGFVSRDLVGRIKDRFGTLFGGVSPDIYSAALISEMATNVWQVDFPFCLPGGAPTSTAGSGAARSDMTSLAQNPHTAAFADLRWDPTIPAFYAPYIVWSYSLKQAVDRLGHAKLQPNLARLFAIALMKNREQAALIEAARAEAGQRGYEADRLAIAREVAREVAFQAKRFGSRLLSPRAGGRAQRFGDLADVGTAYDQLQHYIDVSGVALQLPDLDPDALQANAER